jgi:hypothetical protein
MLAAPLITPVHPERTLMAFAQPLVETAFRPVQLLTLESRVVQGEGENESGVVFARFNVAGRTGAAPADDVRHILRSAEFSKQLDELRGNLQKELDLDQAITVSVAGVSLGLSLLYVVWLIRGGVLVGSYLSALPAWRVLDPLPVLSRVEDDAQQDDDEALDTAAHTGADPLRGFG